ncbi:hypothetical protein CYMTET_34365 [Cymbomonas tetramitiformis]|uniref:Glutathione S-transferase n=1 Tax=Cymbomonas tetramitiformis TaxID=36881 RepID=A0AAE0FB82_9CHLO|nr:hypothetical protein CYMTET_34365 [Cymbomonas tetramitiformis]|eukprot:gene3361-4228_t
MAYTLKYFGIPALGEPIRLVLHLGGLDWKDERMQFADWGPIKPTTKWGQCPLLTTPDGKEMTQSKAILRYLSKIVEVEGNKLYPDDALAAFEVDEMIDVFEDLRLKLVPTFKISDPEEKSAARAALFAAEGECTMLLQKIEKFCGEKFVVAGQLTMADIWVYFFLNFLRSGFWDGLPVDYLGAYPKLTAVVDNVAALPQVKEYYAGAEASKGPMYKVFDP